MPRFRRNCLIGVLASGLLAACGSDSEPDAGPAIDASTTGTFSLAWAVTDGASAIPCADVEGISVRIAATEVNAAFGNVVVFNCDDAMGTSRRLQAGTYRLDIDLRTGTGRSLLAAPIRVEDVEITIEGNTEIDAQTFTVIPQGSLAFSVAAVGAVGNCTDIASGGAGILSLQFHLRNPAGTCVPTTFTIAAGGQAGGTYTSDCTDNVTFNCIEPDQAVTVAQAPSGERRLEIIGIIEGDIPCRRTLSQFSIPGNNLDATLGELGLAIDTVPPGCEGL